MLQVLTYPNPLLKEVSKPVESFDPALHTLLDAMAETMYAMNGIGLAAPQVDKRLRVFLIDLGLQEGYEQKLHEFINPILSQGKGSTSFQEGCLSVPGYTELVKRKATIRVDYQDRFGKKHVLHADDLLAVAIQHENDHLDGVLFVERLSPLKRRMAKKKLEKSLQL